MVDSAALMYLDSALTIMQRHALQHASVNWPQVRVTCVEMLANTPHPDAPYTAIRYALAQLRDQHSHFVPPQKMRDLEHGIYDSANRLPEGTWIKRIGYLTVPAFQGSTDAAIHYAETLHTLFTTLSARGVDGWIIDLTRNDGGDVYKRQFLDYRQACLLVYYQQY